MFGPVWQSSDPISVQRREEQKRLDREKEATRKKACECTCVVVVKRPEEPPPWM